MDVRATDINAVLLLANALKIAKAQAAGNIDTVWIDRTDFESAMAFAGLGAAAGAPATQSLKLQIFDADDNAGANAAQVKPDGVTAIASVTGATADNTATQLGVTFANCRQWVKVRAVLAFTGGAGPTQDVAIGLVLSGGRNLPTTPLNA